MTRARAGGVGGAAAAGGTASETETTYDVVDKGKPNHPLLPLHHVQEARRKMRSREGEWVVKKMKRDPSGALHLGHHLGLLSVSCRGALLLDLNPLYQGQKEVFDGADSRYLSPQGGSSGGEHGENR